MRVLFVSSEIYPFAKTGGLADVSYSLPKALSQVGVQVSTVMPLYKCVNTEKHRIKPTGESVEVEIGAGKFTFELYRCGNQVTHYFLKNDRLFGREFLYGTPYGDYPDNDVRFGSFCWAVAQLVKRGSLRCDVIHTNDWQAALIPVLAKEKLKLPVKTLQTIHNIAYQGIFPKEAIERLSLGWELFHMEALEFWGKVNFLKGGIVFGDAVNTVSPTYAKEITTPEFGYGLDGVLRKYSYKLFGILNGIDYDVWNPETDPHLYVNYTEASVERKEENKELFLEETGLKGKEKPLFVFIGRFAKQKGVDLILRASARLAQMPANFAILGFGDEAYNEAFQKLNELENFFVKVAFDEPLSRKMYGSADFLLMPSLYEPCGLNQMIAMRYGTLVVARKTGGLADTVVDISEPGGYGILFEPFTPEAFTEAVERGVKLYWNSRERFYSLRRAVMELDFSWNASALKYTRLYENLLEGKLN
ncbi:glycogen synthase GlgA [Thermovibrio ammonificans]